MIKNNWQPTDKLTASDLNNISNAVNKNTEHKEAIVQEESYTHGLKFDSTEKKLILQTADGEEVVIGGNAGNINFDHTGTNLESSNVQDVIKEIYNKKISDENGVFGIEYVESDGSLLIEKQNGDKTKFESGMNPDELLKDLVDGMDELILKIGLK